MNLNHIVKGVVSTIDGEFNAVQVRALCVERYGITPVNVSTYLANYYKTKELKKVRKDVVTTSDGRACQATVWLKTPKFKPPRAMEAYVPTEPPMVSWGKVYPEFFTQFPIPTGRVYRLEM